MPEQLMYDGRAAGAGSKETIRPSDFVAATLRAGAEVTVWSEEVANDEYQFHGYGVQNREYAEGFVGLDLVASGNGAGAAGDPIEGDLILAVTTNDGKRVLASTTFEDLDELRDSLSESRSDRVVEPAHTADGDVAGPGRNLEIRIDADSASDGVEVDPTASNGKLYYGEIRQ